jgi:hypothetical protein
MMKIDALNDVKKDAALISRVIERYGSSPEHNFGCYLTFEDKHHQDIFLKANGYGILTYANTADGEWSMVGNPLAPEEKRVELLASAVEYALARSDCKKFVVELKPGVIEALRLALGDKYTVHDPRFVLYWPVFDMNDWEGDRLRGGAWKKIRNLINRVRRFHRIRVVDSAGIHKEKLKEVVHSWEQHRKRLGYGVNRKDNNSTEAESYIKMIDMDFYDAKYAKTVLVDGVPRSITVGWDIPNSNRAYYSSVGIYSYGFEGLGEYTNWDDLRRLKGAGYNHVDFGGSPKPLLQFKQKFKPQTVYQTHTCSITRRD